MRSSSRLARSRRSDRRDRLSAPQGRNRAYVRSISRTLDRLARLAPEGAPLALRVDGRRDYLFAWRSHADRDRFRLEVYPNPVRGPKGSPRSAEAVVRNRAMALDLANTPWTWSRVLAERLFPSRENPPEPWNRILGL